MNKALKLAGWFIILAAVAGGAYYYLNADKPVKDASDAKNEQVSVRPTSDQQKTSAQETRKITEKTSTYEINLEYPYFPGLDQALNKFILDLVNGKIAEFKTNVSEERNPAEVGSYLEGSWTPVYINGKYVSFILRMESYTGGANVNPDLATVNYDIEKEQILKLADLFPGNPAYLKSLSEISRKKLAESIGDQTDANSINEGTEPLIENFSYFNFTDDSIIIYFPKYQVAPGALGEQIVTIKMSEAMKF